MSMKRLQYDLVLATFVYGNEHLDLTQLISSRQQLFWLLHPVAVRIGFDLSRTAARTADLY
jgi:hypothetical protein